MDVQTFCSSNRVPTISTFFLDVSAIIIISLESILQLNHALIDKLKKAKKLKIDILTFWY